jgi:hypothetical protein
MRGPRMTMHRLPLLVTAFLKIKAQGTISLSPKKKRAKYLIFLYK